MSGRSAHFLFTGAAFFGGEKLKDDLAVRVKEATSNLLDGLSLELVDVTIGREKGRYSLGGSYRRPLVFTRH